jgi:hypothetical protein
LSQVIRVFGVQKGEVFGAPVLTATTEPTPKTVSVLSELIRKSWKTDSSDQLFLTENGHIADPADQLAKFCTEQVR